MPPSSNRPRPVNRVCRRRSERSSPACPAISRSHSRNRAAPGTGGAAGGEPMPVPAQRQLSRCQRASARSPSWAWKVKARTSPSAITAWGTDGDGGIQTVQRSPTGPVRTSSTWEVAEPSAPVSTRQTVGGPSPATSRDRKAAPGGSNQLDPATGSGPVRWRESSSQTPALAGCDASSAGAPGTLHGNAMVRKTAAAARLVRERRWLKAPPRQRVSWSSRSPALWRAGSRSVQPDRSAACPAARGRSPRAGRLLPGGRLRPDPAG